MQAWWIRRLSSPLFLLLLLLAGVGRWGPSPSRASGGDDDPPPAEGGGGGFADVFPSLEVTLRMARFSKLAYSFKDAPDPENRCEGYRDPDDPSVRCEWYEHDRCLGTQVLIVTSSSPAAATFGGGGGGEGYVGVIFAGTDDFRTSLEDAHVAMKPFGNKKKKNGGGDNSTTTVSLPDGVMVHAGFNNAVFLHGVWDRISSRVDRLVNNGLHHHPPAAPRRRIYVAGHSLGGANSLLTATALSLVGHDVTSISFGCPHTGNGAWHEYFVGKESGGGTGNGSLAIWRVVLGWDLVPRLPDFFFHAGHTIQLWDRNHHHHHGAEGARRGDEDGGGADDAAAVVVEAYYQHYGNESLGYAGAPPGWNAKSRLVGPVALTSHFMTNYIYHLETLSASNVWVDDFKRSDGVLLAD